VNLVRAISALEVLALAQLSGQIMAVFVSQLQIGGLSLYDSTVQLCSVEECQELQPIWLVSFG
jgi:hypothetical protein